MKKIRSIRIILSIGMIAMAPVLGLAADFSCEWTNYDLQGKDKILPMVVGNKQSAILYGIEVKEGKQKLIKRNDNSIEFNGQLFKFYKESDEGYTLYINKDENRGVTLIEADKKMVWMNIETGTRVLYSCVLWEDGLK